MVQTLLKTSTLVVMLTILAFVLAAAHDPETPYPLCEHPQAGQVFHIPTGFLVDRQTLLRTASDAQIIYVAETHDDLACHYLQLDFLRFCHHRYPQKTVLAMEIFTRAQQPILDRWTRGEIDEKSFLRQIGWYTLWGLDFDYYRDLLLFAREHEIPIIGLNAEPALVDAIKSEPIEGLPPSVQQQLPHIDLSDPYHRTVTEVAFDAHRACGCGLEGFHRAQSLWEETMAETIASFFKTEGYRDYHMIVAAGKQHIGYGLGIPRRVFRRFPSSYQLIGVENPQQATKAANEQASQLPLQPFHYLVYADPCPLPERGVTLGIRMKTTVFGVLLTHVVPGSIADRHDLLPGDILLRWNKQPLAETLDLKYLLRGLSYGDHALITLLRQGRHQQISVQLDNTQPN